MLRSENNRLLHLGRERTNENLTSSYALPSHELNGKLEQMGN